MKLDLSNKTMCILMLLLTIICVIGDILANYYNIPLVYGIGY